MRADRLDFPPRQDLDLPADTSPLRRHRPQWMSPRSDDRIMQDRRDTSRAITVKSHRDRLLRPGHGHRPPRPCQPAPARLSNVFRTCRIADVGHSDSHALFGILIHGLADLRHSVIVAAHPQEEPEP
jgi:hypothetical protein